MMQKQTLSEKEFYDVLTNYGMPISMNESACIYKSLSRENQFNIDDFFNKIRVKFNYFRDK